MPAPVLKAKSQGWGWGGDNQTARSHIAQGPKTNCRRFTPAPDLVGARAEVSEHLDLHIWSDREMSPPEGQGTREQNLEIKGSGLSSKRIKPNGYD